MRQLCTEVGAFIQDDHDLEDDWVGRAYEDTEVKNFNDFRAAKDAQQEVLFDLVDNITSVIEDEQESDTDSEQGRARNEPTSTLTA